MLNPIMHTDMAILSVRMKLSLEISRLEELLNNALERIIQLEKENQ